MDKLQTDYDLTKARRNQRIAEIQFSYQNAVSNLRSNSNSRQRAKAANRNQQNIKDEIIQYLQLFVREKERRKSLQDYELKKEHDLILIWDEINDCRNNWSKKDKDEAARCLTILLDSKKYKIAVFAMM